MKTKDQAILLRKINYSETSLILTLLCRQSGLRTFIFQGGKKKTREYTPAPYLTGNRIL